MFQLIAVILSLLGVSVAFLSPVWAWTPILLGDLLLYSIFLSVRTRRWGPVAELSPAANEMLWKFGHYYAMPFAGRSVSAAASMLALAGIPIAVISVVKGFWWVLAIGTCQLPRDQSPRSAV